MRVKTRCCANPIRQFVGKYQRHKDDIRLRFVNPDAAPDEVRNLGISR